MKLNIVLIFTILFVSVSTSKADIIVGHGMAGFSLYAGTAKVCGVNNSTSRIIGYIGAIIGMTPDILGAYGNVMLNDNYRLNHIAHTWRNEMRYISPIALHLYIDELYHIPYESGGGWNYTKWPLFVAVFIIEAVITYFIWVWTN